MYGSKFSKNVPAGAFRRPVFCAARRKAGESKDFPTPTFFDKSDSPFQRRGRLKTTRICRPGARNARSFSTNAGSFRTNAASVSPRGPFPARRKRPETPVSAPFPAAQAASARRANTQSGYYQTIARNHPNREIPAYFDADAAPARNTPATTPQTFSARAQKAGPHRRTSRGNRASWPAPRSSR